MEGFNGLFAGWMWVFWILALLAIISPIWWLARRRRRTRPPRVGPAGIELNTTTTAEELLKKRHERGEITKEQLEQQLLDVRS
jgi:uncharacterized membrane protein